MNIDSFLKFSLVGYYQSSTIPSVHLSVPVFLPLIQLLLRQYGPVKTSSGPKFDYSWQLHSHTLMGLGNPDQITYVQDILAYGWTLRSHKNEFLRLLLPNCEVSNMHSLLDRSMHLGYGCSGGRFPVAPSSYIILVRAVYRQRIYYYFVQFWGMLHCWLQRYHARITTFGTSLYEKLWDLWIVEPLGCVGLWQIKYI